MKPAINLTTIKKSLNGLSQSIKNASQGAENISKNVDEDIKVSRNRLSMSSKMFARKRDLMRRREREDILEASGIIGSIRNTGKIIKKNTRGFLGRIMDFIALTIVGWAFLNLPKIIKLSQDLIKRMQKYFGALNGFIKNIQLFFTQFGAKLIEVGQDITRINFEPALKNVTDFMRKVRDSFTRITLGTIGVINKFLGKSENDLAKEIGGDFYKMYQQLSGQRPPSTGDEEESDSQNGETNNVGGEMPPNLTNEELIKNGIQVLKDQRGGKLNETQQEVIDSGDNKRIHEMLEDNGVYLYVNEKNGNMGYFPLLNKDSLEAAAKLGVRPVDLSEIPYEGYENKKVKKTLNVGENNNNAIFENIKDGLEDALRLKPGRLDDIKIDVPLELNKLKDIFMRNNDTNIEINSSEDNTNKNILKNKLDD
tara:strand:+ start:194 stop:1465 length:1272 start_codon:yes stop_codon:yes gene_type:complete